MPKVGRPRRNTRRSVAETLFSKTQIKLFDLLFGQAGRAFGVNELITLTRAGSGGVQRELKRLVDSGLITRVVQGRDKSYRANEAGFLYQEIKSIVDKTVGVAGAIRDAITPFEDRIHFAVLFGSVAKRSDAGTSDIDVLIVSDSLTLGDVFSALAPAERRLGRSVSPTVYTASEFHQARRDSFLSRMLANEHVVLLGTEDAIPSTR